MTFSGAFSIVVKDPLYPSQPLYDYDVGAACPVDFSITFSVPTDASDDYDKTLLVHIVDSYRTIKVTVLRPAANHTQQTFGALTEISEIEISFIWKIDEVICELTQVTLVTYKYDSPHICK